MHGESGFRDVGGVSIIQLYSDVLFLGPYVLPFRPIPKCLEFSFAINAEFMPLLQHWRAYFRAIIIDFLQPPEIYCVVMHHCSSFKF